MLMMILGIVGIDCDPMTDELSPRHPSLSALDPVQRRAVSLLNRRVPELSRHWDRFFRLSDPKEMEEYLSTPLSLKQLTAEYIACFGIPASIL